MATTAVRKTKNTFVEESTEVANLQMAESVLVQVLVWVLSNDHAMIYPAMLQKPEVAMGKYFAFSQLKYKDDDAWLCIATKFLKPFITQLGYNYKAVLRAWAEDDFTTDDTTQQISTARALCAVTFTANARDTLMDKVSLLRGQYTNVSDPALLQLASVASGSLSQRITALSDDALTTVDIIQKFVRVPDDQYNNIPPGKVCLIYRMLSAPVFGISRRSGNSSVFTVASRELSVSEITSLWVME